VAKVVVVDGVDATCVEPHDAQSHYVAGQEIFALELDHDLNFPRSEEYSMNISEDIL
jgi:hypothetical protein